MHVDARRVRGHRRVAVALAAVVVGERHRRVEELAAGDSVQKILRPVDPPARAVRVAVVAGRVRSWPALADRGRHDDAVLRDASSEAANARAPYVVPRGDRDPPAPHDVQDGREVHVHPDRDRGIAAGEPARRHEHVVHRLDAEAAQVARGPAPRSTRHPQGGGALEGEASVPVVLGGACGEVVGEGLGELDEPRAGLCAWHEARTTWCLLP